jgi:hypothetical protein
MKNTELYGSLSYVISTGYSKQKTSALQTDPAALVARRRRSAGKNNHTFYKYWPGDGLLRPKLVANI